MQENKKRYNFLSKTLNNSSLIIFHKKMIERVNKYKHLGVYLSSSLDWSRQVHEIGRKQKTLNIGKCEIFE